MAGGLVAGWEVVVGIAVGGFVAVGSSWRGGIAVVVGAFAFAGIVVEVGRFWLSRFRLRKGWLGILV